MPCAGFGYDERMWKNHFARACTAVRAPAWVLGVALAALPLGCGSTTPAEPMTPVPLATATPDEGAPETEESSFLDIMSGQPTEIRVDGKPVGKTPIQGYKVSPGTHDVTFLFSDDNRPTLSVTVEPNKGAIVKLDPPPTASEPLKSDDASKKPPPKK